MLNHAENVVANEMMADAVNHVFEALAELQATLTIASEVSVMNGQITRPIRTDIAEQAQEAIRRIVESALLETV